MAGGLGQTLESAFMGDVDYDPKAEKLEQQKANQERALGLEARGQQQALGQALRNQMAGKGPSVAQQQMMQGREAMMRGATAAAASGRGVGTALASRQGMTAGQNIALQTNRDAAMARQAEQLAATNLYANQLQGMRGQDAQARAMSIDEAKAQLDYMAKYQANKAQIAMAEQKGSLMGVGAVGSFIGGISDPAAKTNVKPVGQPPTSYGSALAGALDGRRVNWITEAPPMQTEQQASPAQSAPPEDKKSSEYDPGFGQFGTEQGALQGMRGFGTAAKDLIGSDPAMKAQVTALTNENASLRAALADMGKQAETPKMKTAGTSAGAAVRRAAARAKPMATEAAPQPAVKYSVRDVDGRTKVWPEAQSQPLPVEEQNQLTLEGLRDAGLLKPDELDVADIAADRPVSDPKAKKVQALSSALSKTKAERYPVTEQMKQIPNYEWNYANNQTGNWKDQLGGERQVTPMATSGNGVSKGLDSVPVTEPAVERGPDGLARVNTPKLTMVNTGAIAEMARRLDELEKQKDLEYQDLSRRTGAPGSALKKSLAGKGGSSAGRGLSDIQPAGMYLDREPQRREQRVPTLRKSAEAISPEGVAAKARTSPFVDERYQADPAKFSGTDTVVPSPAEMHRDLARRSAGITKGLDSEKLSPEQLAWNDLESRSVLEDKIAQASANLADKNLSPMERQKNIGVLQFAMKRKAEIDQRIAEQAEMQKTGKAVYARQPNVTRRAALQEALRRGAKVTASDAREEMEL